MKHSLAVDKLAKMLFYMLGRHPEEFCLLPDENGYVKIKDLMKALGEEHDWRHVRSSHVHEVLYSNPSPVIEMQNKMIRAADRSRLLKPAVSDVFPKLLYYPVRQRAYPVVLGKGVMPADSRQRIILTENITLAERLGQRIDRSPVILTVNSASARKKGATLWRFGDTLCLSDCLPIGSFSGPPLPKNRPVPKSADKPEPQDNQKTPGSFNMNLTNAPGIKNRSKKGSRQRKNEWKRDRKHNRNNTW